jgi:uncharacterized protein (DUF433 family)
MSGTLTPVNHVRLDENAQAWVGDTSYRVLDIVLDHLAHGWSPEEIHFQHYGVPSLAEIHAALAYYYDHQTELDAQIEREVKDIDRRRAEAGESPFRKRMRTEGKLP